eukprot:6195307-Pleurochrysis_carterae.AAC.1
MCIGFWRLISLQICTISACSLDLADLVSECSAALMKAESKTGCTHVSTRGGSKKMGWLAAAGAFAKAPSKQSPSILTPRFTLSFDAAPRAKLAPIECPMTSALPPRGVN